MAFTDNCDLFLAVHENGVNRVIQHVVTQRPSLVNYGSAGVVADPGLLCAAVKANPVVLQRHNPLVAAGPMLPVVGTNGAYMVEYAVQLTLAEADFSPGTIALPAELNPPLPAQHFAAHTTVCAGIGCPPEEVKAHLPQLTRSALRDGVRGGGGVVIPVRQLTCFCLDLFATGGIGFTGPVGDEHLLGRLDGLDIVDIEPAGLESAIICYLELVIRLAVLPRLSVPVIQLTRNLIGLATVTVQPKPTSAAVPYNPALEDDQVKAFLSLTVSPAGGGGGGGGGGSSPPVTPGVPRPRVRAGPFDGTAALSKPTFRGIFAVARDGFKLNKSGGASFGPFSASYAVAAHLEDGTVDLHNDDTISISGLDIKWDTLQVCFGIDIPQICVGGFCIIPKPLGGCIVRAPKICVFSNNPDIEFCLNIGGLITSEVSATLTPLTKYSVNPGRTQVMNDWDAADAGVPNHWQLYVDPITVHLDLFDIAASVGGLLNAAVNAAIDALLGPLPGWAKDLINTILGPVIDVVKAILGFGNDVADWLSDLLGSGLGLFDIIVTAIADYFAKDHPLFQLADPVQILPASGGLIQILIPVEFIGVQVTADEMIVEADIGD